MQQLQKIRDYYRPIQPSVSGGGEILYREVEPGPKIAHLVYCYWQLQTREWLNQPFIYRVVSVGCIDIFYNHLQPVENFVMGFCRKYTEFPIGRSFHYIGIRFLPAALPLLSGVDAKSLSNQSQELKHVCPDLSEWMVSSIKPSSSFEHVVKLLDRKLSEVAEAQKFDLDLRLVNALETIFQKHGYLNTETELNIGLSPRQLRRIFNFYLGTTAKTFSNVVRFQHILNARPSKQSLKQSKLYLDAGFFDQAHFIKQFKTFYGVTPSEAFS